MSLNAACTSLLFLFSVCMQIISFVFGLGLVIIRIFFKDTFIVGCQKFTKISIPSQDLCL